MKTKNILFIILLLIPITLSTYYFGRSLWIPVKQKIIGKQTTADIVVLYGEQARNQLLPYFNQAQINYPPKQITLLAMKEEQLLELWASDEQQGFTYIRSYKIQKTSGKAGPKLREGDRQVPEGLYKVIGLNPNSSYHLSMKISYPNAFDLSHAKQEGRTQPGSNIFIHGKAVSIGCLAMGDQIIEELFVLANDVAIENISVVIAPSDPRKQKLKYDKDTQPEWIPVLYQEIEQAFSKYL